MKSKAILELYPQIISCWNSADGNTWKYFDVDSNQIEVSIDWDAVNTRATELQTAQDAKVAQLATDKASAKAKLIAGEALTEAEADTIVI